MSRQPIAVQGCLILNTEKSWDVTHDEDRCRIHVRDLSRILAGLTNTAISIIRGRLRCRLRARCGNGEAQFGN